MHILTSKRIISMFGGVALMGSALLSSALPAMADQAPDKNGPGVARVSMISGSAVVQRGDSNEQVAAVLNAPLLPGDYISTGATSRAEVQFDGTTAVRLGGNVQARITNNDPNDRQLQLADGTIEVGVVHQGTPLQIDTPSVSMRAAGVGDYRVSIGRDGSSWVTVRRGQAEISTPQRTYTLDTGRTMVARGSASDPSITYTSEVGYDSFDDFSAKRDEKMIAALDASPNLNPDIAGYDNLAQYGQWQDVPGYGNSWIPNEPSGWSPYHDGDWSWEDGYGWTWVGSEPWGWAPYHYGRWYYANNYGWAWAPPAYGAAAAWSPALVGFFGFGLSFGGPGWGVSLGFGDGGYGGYGGGYPYIGWCPLPPAAPYYPWYPGWAWTGYGWGYPYYGGYGWGGTRYVSITNIYNNYYHHGGSGTLVGNFQHGRLSGHVITVDPHKVGRIGGIQGAVPVTPTHENLGFGGRTISAPVTLSRAFRSPRFAENRAIAARTPFERQQQAVSRALRANAGHFNAPVTSGRNNGTGRIDGNGRQNQPAGSWARFNQDRGNQDRGNQDRGNVAGARQNGNYDPGRVSGFGRSEAGAGRQNNAAGDSWGRFSRDRGNVSGTYDRVNGNNNGRGYNDAGNRGYGNPYERSAYPSYARPSNSSYARPSNPSYSRGSYDRGGYGSPYTRNSYPSYARPSYPSPSRGSYSAAPREAYPSYSRGGGGGYSAPHASGGGYSAPRQSGNGGGGGGERGNGGGGNGRGGGRPPQQKP